MGSRFPPRLWHPGLSWFTMSGRIEQSKSLPCPYSQARAHWKLGQSVDLPKENEAMSQGQRKKIEIFSSSCSICNETVERLNVLWARTMILKFTTCTRDLSRREQSSMAWHQKRAGYRRGRQARGLLCRAWT